MAAPAKHTARQPSLTKLSTRVEELDQRLRIIEEALESAKLAKQREAAAKLAQNPEQLAALQALLQLAEEQKQNGQK